MILEGYTTVIDAIKEKKRLMDTGVEHGHIKPLLIIDGGLMKGAYGVGAAIALEEAGLSYIFTDVIGVSSGAPTAAYLLSGDTHEGSSVLIDDCTSRKFLNVWRFWKQVNTQYIMDSLMGEPPRGINAEKILTSASSFHIGVSDFKTGKPSLLKPTNREELFQAIHASILMPNVSTANVKFNDIRYVDGGFTRPHIMRKVIDEIKATHMLVITNQDQTVSTIPMLERILNHTLYRHRMPKALRFAAHERRRERMKAIEYMKKNYATPYALIWGDHSIRSMERNSKKVREVVEKSRLWWHELLK